MRTSQQRLDAFSVVMVNDQPLVIVMEDLAKTSTIIINVPFDPNVGIKPKSKIQSPSLFILNTPNDATTLASELNEQIARHIGFHQQAIKNSLWR